MPFGITEEEYNDEEFKRLVRLEMLTPIFLKLPDGTLIFDEFSERVMFETLEGKTKTFHKDDIKIDYEVIGA